MTTEASTTTTDTTVWYEGVDAEVTGFWKNKGLDLADPKKFATGLTTMYREAEKFVGAPPSQLLRLPVDPIKDADMMNTVWQRLGKPDDASKYDFPALKGQDGKVADTALDSALREGLFKANTPQPIAAEVATIVTKHLANLETARAAEAAAVLKTEQETLAKNWGANAPQNKVVAQNAAKALGIAPEEVNALEKIKGYAATMEMLRNIGSKIGEDKFIVSPQGSGGTMSKDQAQARIAELMSDKAWTTRYTGGDKTAFREYQDLLKITTAGRESRL